MKLDLFVPQGRNFLGELSDKQKSKPRQHYLMFCTEQVSQQNRSYSYCLTLETLSSLVLPKGASITPAWPRGITARTSVLTGRGGARRILLKERDGPGNDATMTRPMQENTTFKTLNFLGQSCPEDPGLCVPVYSSVPWQLLTQNNMQKAECTNSQSKHLHWTPNEVKTLGRQKPAVYEHVTPVPGAVETAATPWHNQIPKPHCAREQ